MKTSILSDSDRVGRGGMGQRGEMGQLILFIINGYWETFFKIFLPLSMDH